MDKSMSKKSVGRRLAAARIAKNVGTQAAMAKLLGVETNRYNNWETGVAMLPVSYAVKVHSLTGAGLDYLFRDDRSGLPVRLITLLEQAEQHLREAV